ncbi:MAG: carboxypeptidase regulatory-like domain-containing protein [Acidobacteria bacterium]|nr:carboxypeptidase regulatory-like domain-containing protein [Acidobacteriota bacterium]
MVRKLNAASPLLALSLWIPGARVSATITQAGAQSPPAFVQRIPRQAAAATAAIQGIVRNEDRLGLGGVTVILRDVSGGQSFQANTTGDGVFRLLNLPAGRYEMTARREGFEPFERADIPLAAGDVFTLDMSLKMIPAAGPMRLRELPRWPDLGPLPPPPAAAPASPYHTLTWAPAPGPAGEPPQALPPDDKVFARVPDRWTYQWPIYRRYSESGEYPWTVGHWYDPFSRHKLKGDYPLFGRTFLNITGTSDTFVDGRRLPTPSNVGAERPGSKEFFGRSGQFFTSENLSFSFDLFHGDTSFRPIDWRFRVTPEVNINYFNVKERGIVNADVRKGTTRTDAHLGLQEAFFEVKLHDLSHDYDFVSARAGIQPFTSDFRGFIFSDQEPGFRLFGNLRSNRYQYNAAYFSMLEKDTNSGLNTLQSRNQQVFIANLYRQDFIKLGYTIQASFHYDKDDPSFQLDNNNFLVRPAPIGNVREHSIRAYYLGVAGDGHIGRINVSHAFYQVLGHDKFNLIAGRRVDINARMAALELSRDKDWMRFKASFFWASGDSNPRDGHAHGFDAIFDNPNFAGGFFSFWGREGIRLTSTGVGLDGLNSLLPSLRSSKTQGQANFVNPGLYLYNAGADLDLTPKMRVSLNENLVRFHHTAPLELLLFQKPVHAGIGSDSSIGASYRPTLSDNIIFTGGVSVFSPFRGFREIYTGQTLVSLFSNIRVRF